MPTLSNDWLVIGTIAVAAASEIIAYLPIKSNSVVQLVLNILKLVFVKK